MLMRVLKRFRPTPSATVSLLALVVALGSTGWAANGGAFILGVINGATQRTYLGANYNGTALQLNNTSAGASATALTLTVAAGHPPMKVNAATKVVNLNADYVDGIDAGTQLTRVMRVNYSLAAHAIGASITLPTTRPMQLVASNLTLTDEGLGQASLVGIGQGVQWVGLNSYPHAVPASQGVSAAAGTPIIYIDYLNDVLVEVAGTNSIRVHNTNSVAESGSLTLMW